MPSPARTLALLVALVAGTLLGAVLSRGDRAVGAEPARPVEAPAPSEVDRLRNLLEAEREAWAAAEAQLREENRRLTRELVELTERSVRREEQLTTLGEMTAALATSEAPREIVEAMMGIEPEPVPEPEPVEPDPEELALLARSEEIGRSLRALLIVDGIDSLDLLEAGRLGEGFIGPVVFRLIDERGRPVGSLSADRLRLEGSRAGRTLSILLEDGYERRGGQKIPFEGGEPGVERTGVRRIVLQQTDPRPWIERCPELFRPDSRLPLPDDGRWHVFLVHRRLNELLEADSTGGYWRVSALGGVVDDVLRTVELEQLDPGGHVTRRLLADRMSVDLAERGVRLTLEDGVQLAGIRKLPFLDGRYRIFLPAADPDAWLAAGLPGLVDSSESSAGSQTFPKRAKR